MKKQTHIIAAITFIAGLSLSQAGMACGASSHEAMADDQPIPTAQNASGKEKVKTISENS